jgi:hypothetical protein
VTRKLIVLLLSSILLCLSVTANTHAQPKIRYAVAFPHGRNAQLAVFYSDDTVKIKPLPGSFFAQGDVALIRPLWSPSGDKIYYSVKLPAADPDSEEVREVRAYDLAADTTATIVTLPERANSPEYVLVDSVSPDGRFLVVTRFLGGRTNVVDLQAPADQRAGPELPDCPISTLAWSPTYLLAYDFYCPFTFRVLDPKTRQSRFTFPEEERLPLYDNWYYIPDANPVFIGAGYAGENAKDIVAQIDLTTGKATILGAGRNLIIAPDKSFAVYESRGSLKRFTFASRKLDDLGPVGNITTANLGESALTLWQVIRTETAFKVVLTRVTATGRTDEERPIHSVASKNEPAISLAPSGMVFAIHYGTQVTLYASSGKLWSSEQALSTEQAIAGDVELDWSQDGQWLLVPVIANSGDQPRHLSVNVTKGDTILAPRADTYYVSGSPDGKWWLYATTSEWGTDNKVPDMLVAYYWETGKTVELDRGILGQRNFHWSPGSYYVWSPVLR